MNNKDLDILIRESLSNNLKPDVQLNEKLKYQIRQRAGEKERSLWWLPMLVSVIFMAICTDLVAYFVPVFLFKLIIYVFAVLTTGSSIILTVIGVKKYDLKKGAVI